METGDVREDVTPRQRVPISRLVLLVGGLGLGIVLLVLLLRSVNLGQLGKDFQHVDYRYLAIATVPFLVNWLLKVPRWALLFGDDAPGWDTLFGAMNVGYAINSLLPARLGEVVRAYWVRDRGGVGMVKTLSTIAVERVLDGLTLLIVFFLLVPTVAFPRRLLGSALVLGALFVIVMLLMIVLAYTSSRENHPLSRWMTRNEAGRRGILVRVIRQGVEGLHAFRSGRVAAVVLLYTVVIWSSNALLVWLVLRAFHVAVPLTAGGLITSVLNLGMAVPSTPGYVGVFDGLMVLTLGLYGVQRTLSLAAAFAFHLIAFLPMTIVGLVYILRFGVQMTLQMVRAAE